MDLHLTRTRAAAMALLLFPAPVLAQSTTGTLTGVVRDSSRAVVAGATVTAHHLETGLQRATSSQTDGRYVLLLMPVGAYEIRAEREGFRPYVRRGVSLAVGESAAVDVSLDVGGLEQEITVTAEANRVRSGTGELSYLVGEEAVRDLPLNGRNYTDLALLQPGVIGYPHRDGGSVVAHGLGMSVNGQDPRSNVYLLDGTLLNDFTNGPAGSAAGTALGSESVREFRVAANAYGAEFGRNSGGQINVITKSGTNDLHGSAYEFHRNDALDNRNFFDTGEKPDFTRHQFGATVGGPLRKDRTFFFVGVEALRERLGRTISTVVPDENARRGLLPSATAPGQTVSVPVEPAVRPYLDAFPLPNGQNLGGGLAAYTFPFPQRLDQEYIQLRLDQRLGQADQLFVRYTHDRAENLLPTDFPQFPRTFASRNQFLTGEYRRAASARTMHTLRLGWSRTRIGQEVEANVSLPPFVAGRPSVGDIDIGGIPRFGPQSSAGVNLRQTVYAAEYGMVHVRGSHLLKAGALVEHYRDGLFNPTFSLGIYTFAGLESFLRNRPLRFVGLTPEGDLNRLWPFTLFAGYVQDDLRLGSRLVVNAGLRYEYATLPRDSEGRDSTLLSLLDREPTLGQLYQNPTGRNLSPRLGFAWDVTGDGRTSLRGGYGLYFNTNNQQNLIVTITNPPFTPRVIIANPTFPDPPFARGVGNSIRPVQWDLENPRVHVWNVSLERELRWKTVASLGYAGSRGVNLLRNGDVNVPTPVRQADGTIFYPPTVTRPNTAFSTIEQKTSDGDSWYNALLFEVRRRSSDGLSFQSSYTFSRNIDTTQASTFFSDATNGTATFFPEPFGIDYNKGLADYHAKHNWVFNLTWDLPLGGAEGKGFLAGWQLALIGQMRSGSPLSVFVQSNRSRSLSSPSIGPGLGLDRASLAPGRTAEDAVVGRPDQWFDPTAFVLPPAGTLGNTGRGAFVGPDLRVVDLALVKRIAWGRLGPAGRVELRAEAFNIFNRANLGVPAIIAFAGARDGEAPLSSFGRVRNTVTAARQVQLGLRVAF